MSREGLELARIARSQGVPIVLSPICWIDPRAIWALESGLARKLGGLARWGLRLAAPKLGGWRRELLELADAILPNSQAEATQIQTLFAVDANRIKVVPNGVSDHFLEANPNQFRSLHGDREFVLFVGRIEPRKNPLGVIRACRMLGLPIVVIGDTPAGHEEYAARCRREGGTELSWLRATDHHDPLLASAYAAAKVFALPSWFETPGLAALEAALAGCPVVVTPFGSTREYFGSMATYAPPHSVRQIADAILDCWDRGKNSRLSGSVASRYLWPVVGQRTAEIYDQITG
jgi:glycosyltransferase involved in cell wall biosynthesis